ncbi:MAG: hydrogenase nickel incorporation protein HypB [Kiritimatiellae bacterium]|nr:hydrogenase nickel incorporation protein HypB [Kiritimatiellia bacterium]MDW8457899.1 hydrogenase nickel incorporation protein HypB [Verrucomicrobiota bacterium]
MCDHCGCSQAVSHGHHHGEAGETAGHGHAHEHHHEAETRTIELHRSLMALNERLAEQNRGYFKARHTLALNIVSSPGAGKTSLIEATVRALSGEFRMAVIVGDLATDRDAQRIRAAGAPAVQVTTGTVCHLDAHMVQHALENLGDAPVDVLFIENVGNLVCPASFDLGERLRVVVLSVTEGEDKPLKYPSIFQSADAVVLSKIDLALAAGFDREFALANIRTAAPAARIFELSAKTGEGLEPWFNFLRAHAPIRRVS